MAITSPPTDRHAAASSAQSSVPSPLEAMAKRWSALHQAADVAAALAGLPQQASPAALHDFPAIMHAADGWRRTLAEQGLADLSAVMEPGIAGLLQIHARGADPVVAARALWDEFDAARAALLALIPPSASPPADLR